MSNLQSYKTKTVDELLFIIRDAGEAAVNMRGLDSKAEGKYLDQVNDACTVLHTRRIADTTILRTRAAVASVQG